MPSDAKPAWSMRMAVAADAKAIAWLHAASWKAAYRGILPGEYLDAAVDSDRQSYWQAAFAAMRGGDFVVLAEVSGQLIGFAAVMVRPIDGYDAILEGLHVEPTWRGRGAGTAIMAEVAAALRLAGGNSLFLWLLDGNARGEHFYLRIGGRRADRGFARVAGEDVPQTRIVWRDLATLAESCRDHAASSAKPSS
jgi:GNAT superfamily N-acetyltransferase